MADRGRDLKINVVSATEKFDLSDPINQLDHFGDTADTAGQDVERGLEQAGDASKTLGREVDSGLEKGEKALDDLGDKADSTKRDFSRFMDKLGADAKKAGREVDTGMDTAKKGVDDFKDEAGQSGREAAASFSGGFSDVGDFVQETLANGLAGLGPIGAAAGLAAAAGVGFLISKVQEGNERVKEMTQSFLDLRKDGIDPAADAISHLSDEMDAASLSQWKDDADKLGVSYETLREAFDGNAEAIAKVREAQALYNQEHGATIDGQKIAVDRFGGLTEKLKETETAYGNAGDAAAFLGAKTEAAKERTGDMSDALKGVSEDAADMAEAIAAGADAVIDAQNRQLQATLNMEKNTKTVFDRLGQDAIDWALSQGESADEAMQLLANAPIAKGQQIVDNYRKLGKASSEGNAEGLLAGKPGMVSAANEVHAAAQRALAVPVTIPVTLDAPSRAAVQSVVSAVRSAIGTLSVPVRPVVGQVYVPSQYAMRPVP